MNKLTKIEVLRIEKLFKTFSIMPARDAKLSYKARGILYYLLSKPEGWRGQIFDIVKNSEKDGINSVKSALKELVDCGYAKLKNLPTDNGKFCGKFYEISEFPLYSNLTKEE